MTVDHSPIAPPSTTPSQRYVTPAPVEVVRPAWTADRSGHGWPVRDEHGQIAAYAIGRAAADRLAEGMTVYVQLDDDEAAPEAEARADRDLLAAENGALRDERDQLRDQLATRAGGDLAERVERQARTIRDLLRQDITRHDAARELERERDELRERCGRYARDRDDLRNQVIDLHDRVWAAEHALRAARDEAEDAARSANQHRDERDRARRDLATGTRAAMNDDLRQLATALDLPATTSRIALLDRARYLAGVNRDRLRRAARQIGASR